MSAGLLLYIACPPLCCIYKSLSLLTPLLDIGFNVLEEFTADLLNKKYTGILKRLNTEISRGMIDSDERKDQEALKKFMINTVLSNSKTVKVGTSVAKDKVKLKIKGSI